jgi:hypothetical protein
LRNSVVSVPNTIANCKPVSTNSYLVKNALFDISALECFFLQLHMVLLSKTDVLPEYAVKRNLHIIVMVETF